MYKITSASKLLKGTITLPFSKSESNRAIILQHLASNKFHIHNLSDADDTAILKKLLKSDDHILNCGDGGTTLRFLLALLAFKGNERIITGSEYLCSRPVKPLVDALNQLGATITYLKRENFPPLKIGKSSLTKVDSIQIQADVSSQFITAMLLIAPLLQNGLKISLKGKVLSKPYLMLTIGMMKELGIEIVLDQRNIIIRPQEFKAVDITIGADWSSASYFFAMAVLANEADLTFPNLSLNSLQGDKVVAQLMEPFGITTVQESTGIRIIKKSDALLPSYFEFDFTDCPDLSQTFAFVCAALQIPFKLTGLDNLPLKETNRLNALSSELNKMGCNTIATKNSIQSLTNVGLYPEKCSFQSYNDHRMIMAITPMALISPILIDQISYVSKSFPGFCNRQ